MSTREPHSCDATSTLVPPRTAVFFASHAALHWIDRPPDGCGASSLVSAIPVHGIGFAARDFSSSDQFKMTLS